MVYLYDGVGCCSLIDMVGVFINVEYVIVDCILDEEFSLMIID